MTLPEFDEYLADFPWFWPGVAISIVICIPLSGRVARALEVRRALAMALILGVGLIVSATLTPSVDSLSFGTIGRGSCDVGRFWPASVAEFLSFGDPTFNLLLFLPLGVAIGLLPVTRRKLIVAFAALAFPFVIETIQLLATGLDRACQSSDVSDNVAGLVIGFAVGAVVRAWQPRRTAGPYTAG